MCWKDSGRRYLSVQVCLSQRSESVRWSSKLMLLFLVVGVAPLGAQKADVTGTWRVKSGKDVKNGPREVIIRADSSASWGKETVRWRLKGDKSIAILIGGEWETYGLKVKSNSLTLSGGDLEKAVTLQKVGPATPLPAGAKIPNAPGGN
jgi:hypothetical protein